MTNDTTKNSVLIVDDEKANLMVLTHILSSEYAIYAAKNGRDALEAVNEHAPDVILLNVLMPDMNGYEVLAQLKNDEKTRAIPVIFVSELNNVTDEVRGLNLGASDYISKPYHPAIVRLRVQNQIKIVNQISRINNLIAMDQLTGLPNRRFFDDQMSREWGRSRREKTPLSLLLLDVDKFKMVNDTYGHLQGDAVLQIIANTLKESLKRITDIIARWGGEEFIVLLSNTDSDGALNVAEQIRVLIEQTSISIENSKTMKVTISIGVDTLIATQDCSPDTLISHADKALYTAKATGRNRVCKYAKTE